MTCQPCVKSELCLFDPTPVQVSMEKSSWVDIHPIASLDGANTIQFNIHASHDNTYLDLNDTLIYLKVKANKINRTTKQKLPILEADSVTPTNQFLSSLFSDVKLFLNDVQIEGGNPLYGYKAMIGSLLQFDDNVIKTQLQASGFSGKGERQNWFIGNKTKELIGPIHLDFLSQSKYLLPRVNVGIQFNRAKNDFLYKSSGKEEIEFSIQEAVLYVRRVDVAPSVVMGHEIGLKTNNAIYSIQKSSLFTYSIPSGGQSFSQDNLFRGKLPKLVIVTLISNSSYNGNNNISSLSFNHFNLNHIALYRGGECVPYTKPFNPNFSNGHYMREYMAMIQSLEYFNKNESNTITPEKFEKKYCFFLFNLTPDLNMGGSCAQQFRSGNVRLDMGFEKPTSEAINVIIYTISDGKVEINENREVII